MERASARGHTYVLLRCKPGAQAWVFLRLLLSLLLLRSLSSMLQARAHRRRQTKHPTRGASGRAQRSLQCRKVRSGAFAHMHVRTSTCARKAHTRGTHRRVEPRGHAQVLVLGVESLQQLVHGVPVVLRVDPRKMCMPDGRRGGTIASTAASGIGISSSSSSADGAGTARPVPGEHEKCCRRRRRGR
jgi:hypothetical protein